jgi:hypothetical protein
MLNNPAQKQNWQLEFTRGWASWPLAAINNTFPAYCLYAGFKMILNRYGETMLTPCELNWGGVYFPPLLVAGIVGILLTYAITRLLNHYRLSRLFASPPLVFLALTVIFSGLIESLLFR